jgi:hypothetical protein
MTTLAAIDRVVHHSIMLDQMGLKSYSPKAAGGERKHGPRNQHLPCKQWHFWWTPPENLVD